MKHVRLTLDADGREGEIHPMYDVLVNAPYINRATAMHWNFSGEEFGIMHYIEGDITAFEKTLASIPEVLAYELAPAGNDTFYVYIRDATNKPLRNVLEVLTQSPVVVIPPIEYTEQGTVSYSVFGPSKEIQAAIEKVPDPITVEITEVTGMAAVPGVLESLLSDRQRDAINAAFSLGYYEIPREAELEDIANSIGCAPSTAAEHLRRAESKLLQSFFDN